MTTITDKGKKGMEAIQTQKITLDIPLSINQIGLTKDYFQELVAATLFHNGTITSKTACQLLGISRRQLEEDVLPRFGYTHMRDDADNIQIELEASKRK